MKKIYLICFFGLLINRGFGQQTLYNVPSLEITKERTWYFRQGLVFTHSIESGTTLNYGLGSLMDAGMNINHLNIITSKGNDLINVNDDQRERNPNVMLNLQKGFEVTKYFIVSAGTMTGANLGRKVNQLKLADFSFLNTQSSLTKRAIKLIVGGYYANETYSNGENFGAMLGTKIPVVKDKLWLYADWLSGNSNISVITTGMKLELFESWQLSLGGQLPSPGSHNDVGVAFQIARHQ
jgi:hypothetical protein